MIKFNKNRIDASPSETIILIDFIGTAAWLIIDPFDILCYYEMMSMTRVFTIAELMDIVTVL